MSENITFSEESLRKIAEKKVTFRYSVKIHAIIYIGVNILLFIINGVFSANLFNLASWWAIYPALGWLIGLAIHATAYLQYARGTSYETRGIMFNFVAYLFAMLLLAFVDFMTSPALEWLMYPAIFWGLGIVAHIIISSMVTKEKLPKDETKPSKKERAVEKEMRKIREKMKSDVEAR